MDGTDSLNACPHCNRECLPDELIVHKLLCAKFSGVPPAPPPIGSTTYILGLVFPVASSSTPVPTWIPCTSSTDEETSISFQSVDVSSVFGGSEATGEATTPQSPPEALYTERNTKRNRDTTSMLEIWTSGTTATTEGSENGSIKAMGSSFHKWFGPVLALAMTRATGFMVDPGSYRDLSLEDARDVVDFVLDYENPEHGRRIKEALDTLGRETRIRDKEGGGEAVVEEVEEVEGKGKGKDKEKEDGDVIFEM